MNTKSQKSRYVLLIGISIVTLTGCLSLLYLKNTRYVEPGFAMDPSSWVLVNVPKDQELLRAGDQVLEIGSLTREESLNDLTKPLLGNKRQDDVVDLRLARGDEILEVAWRIPREGKFRLGRAYVHMLALSFWILGTLILLCLRPRNHAWGLMVFFDFVWALYMTADLMAYTRVAYTAVLYQMLEWMLIPLSIHLHTTVPSNILRRPGKVILPLLYIAAAVMAVLTFLQVTRTYGISLLLLFCSILIPQIVRLFIHHNPKERIAANLMLGGTVLLTLSFAIIYLAELWGNTNPNFNLILEITAGSVLTVIWPSFYAYAIFKHRMGSVEFRANRVLSYLSFLILYLSAFTIIQLFLSNMLNLEGQITGPLMLTITIFIALGLPLQRRYLQWFERVAYGIHYDPKQTIRFFAERLPTVSDRSALVNLLADEAMPNFMIRESALYLNDGDLHVLAYSRGIDKDPPHLTTEASYFFHSREACFIGGQPHPNQFDWVNLALALKVRGKAIGWWLFGKRDPDDFYSRQDILTLSNMAALIAVAFENARLFEESSVRAGQLEEVTGRLRQMDKLKDQYLADLDQKVSERTRELHQRNLELERLNAMMKTVNIEVGLESVVNTLLNHVMALTPRAQRGLFLYYYPSKGCFEISSSQGYNASIEHASITYESLLHNFTDDPLQIQKGIFVIDDFTHRWNESPFEDLPRPANLLVMTLTIAGGLTGLFALDAAQPEESFTDDDIGRLVRFRDHAITALTRAKALKDMLDKQDEMVAKARDAGMSEIATHVLHEVGNALNQIQISAQMIHAKIQEDRWLNLLSKIVDLLDERKEDLEEFITRDPRGQKLRESIASITTNLRKQIGGIGEESRNLSNYLEGMRSILQFQQQFVKEDKNMQPVSINQVLRNILNESSADLDEKEIEVLEVFAPLPPLPIDHIKLTRIMQCLLQNARESIAAHESHGKILIRTLVTEDSALITVEDNGVGLSNDQDRNLFTQGFTTKKQGKGMGLHYSANAMYEMGGDISINSNGIGSGAVVTLSFPLGPRIQQSPSEKTITRASS